jgi:hypothetical protein
MTNLLHTTKNEQKTQEQGTIVERGVATNNDATCSQCDLVCAFAPCAQGSRADLKRILTTPPETSKV